MTTKRSIDRTVLTLAIVGSLVFLNVIGMRYHARLDLTEDKQFTLSPATTSTLGDLRDPVTVRAYFTQDLPPPFSNNARYVRDLLEEYYAQADGKLRYEFIDPISAESDEDKETKKDLREDIFGRPVREQTSVERELSALGIAPVQVRVNEGDKLEVKRAYMGIAVSYAGENEVIPVVQDTNGLEYDLTTLIRKLTRENRPKVALVVGHEGPDPQREIGRAFGLLSQLYDVTVLDFGESAEIPDDVTVIVVVAPRAPLSDEEQRTIDEFISRGGSAAFFLDAIKPDLATMQAEEIDNGLTPMLASYGITVEPGLVLDPESATIAVTRQQGFMRVQQPVRYPFLPEPRALDADNPLTRGISGVVFPFVSPLAATPAAGVDIDVLVRSSAESWVHLPPFDLNPMRRWTRQEVGGQRSHDLVVSASGVLPSYFENGSGDERAPARVVVAGGASFIGDQFFAEGNEALFLNLMDWLALDDALLSVRTRGLKAAPLAELKDSTRSLVKYANILGVPLLLILFGLLRWRRREARRATVGIS
jgi:gliding-associated putative ABC transporter substrate-binding component GldG